MKLGNGYNATFRISDKGTVSWDLWHDHGPIIVHLNVNREHLEKILHANAIAAGRAELIEKCIAKLDWS